MEEQVKEIIKGVGLLSGFFPSALFFGLIQPFRSAREYLFFFSLRRCWCFSPAAQAITLFQNFNLPALLFFLTKKVTKKSRQTLLLRSFAGPAHLCCDGKRKHSLHSYREKQAARYKGVVGGSSDGAVFRPALFIIARD